MKRVLFVHEQTGQLPLYVAKLRLIRPQEDVALEQVATPGEAVALATEGWDLIIWMNWAKGVGQAIAEVRQIYTGPMLAASSIAPYREEMVRAGCSHNLDSDMKLEGPDMKLEVPAKILEILELK